jgi:tripeptide aminopeptidase
MGNLNIVHTVVKRFLRYVKIDTQSDQESKTFPSTEKQKDLGRVLVEELKAMGIDDAHLDEFGYVYATIPSNSDKEVPVICLCAHMDTSPDVSGKDVKPIIHKNYQGGNIVLPEDNSQIIKFDEYEDLKDQFGNDIITTDGTTLLGADDKAGIAEIMDAANYLVIHPDIKHGKIRILFTPDEEVGKGIDKVDMKKLSADIGYTLDGSTRGTIEDETFSADAVIITINGFNIHPGTAKDKMESAIKIACEIVNELPKDKLAPETTEKKEGFVHPVSISGGVDEVILKFIIRDFETEGLSEKEEYLKNISDKVLKKYKRSDFKFDISESYRNMKFELDKKPEVVEYALEAVKRCGLEPKMDSIRGGTDGSRLSYMGLPCPNIFTGGHAYHSKLEWVSIQDMKKAVETIINLCVIWEEKS